MPRKPIVRYSVRLGQAEFVPPLSRRPFLQRLTPLAWLCVLAVIGGLGVVIVPRVRLRVEAARPIVVATAISRASTPPTLPKITPAVEPQITTAPPQVTSVMTSTNPAPSTTIREIETHIKQYYSLVKQMPLQMYLADKDFLLPMFFVDEPLRESEKAISERHEYVRIDSGDVTVNVVEVSPDGLTATVQVSLKNWMTSTLDTRTGQQKGQAVQQKNLIQIMGVQFDAADQRWKIASVTQ